MTPAAKRYLPNPDLVFRRIAGESLLIPVRGDTVSLQRLFSLDPLGEFIWERLDGVRTVSDLVRAVVETYEVDAARAEADLVRFLDELERHGLVTAASPDGDPPA